MQLMKALEIYKPPFTSDGCYVWSANNVMSLMVADAVDNSESLLERVCELLNGTSTTDNKAALSYDAPEILLNGKVFLVVRGWWHLTGGGGLALPAEEASAIQDEFARFVISKLSPP